jgi:hypothetical protein
MTSFVLLCVANRVALTYKEALYVSQLFGVGVMALDRPDYAKAYYSSLQVLLTQSTRPLLDMLDRTRPQIFGLAYVPQLLQCLRDFAWSHIHAVQTKVCMCMFVCGSSRVRAIPFDLEAIHVPHYTDQRHGVSTTNRLPYDSFRALDMLISWAQAWGVSMLTVSTRTKAME